MRFEWDEEKNRRNRAKHNVSFELALRVFDDPLVLTRQERIVDGEPRWVAIGTVPRTTGGFALLVVAHAARDEGGEEVIRLISARRASSKERKVYEEGDEE